MKRYDAMKCVSNAILDEGLIEAVFLKSSIVRNEDDDYSDVDVYAVVSTENTDAFLKRRIQYIEKYMPHDTIDTMELENWQVVDFDVSQLANDLFMATYTLEG